MKWTYRWKQITALLLTLCCVWALSAPVTAQALDETIIPVSDTYRSTHTSQYDFDYPTALEAEIRNRQGDVYAPYIAASLQGVEDTVFIEYSIDFRSQDFPVGTYCCLAQWGIDLTAASAVYADAHTEYDGVYAYAGLQNTPNGKYAILSIWDVNYIDANGNPAVLQPTLLYAAGGENDGFSGEGTGVHCLVPYEWEEGHWYRMLLQRGFSDRGTATIQQWIYDCTNEQWTKLCEYDTNLPEACFRAPMYFFLENYLPEYAGEVRSMELKNIVLTDGSGNRRSVNSVYLFQGSSAAQEGSYAYGTNQDTLWIVTSGVSKPGYAYVEGASGDVLTVD